jgi:transcriptional regulator with XRE-family HTH domain
MPKSIDVEDFAAKLGLLAKRLNWSRARLAQEVGVDKSLAARWLNGDSRPTGNSLMQITAAAAQAVPGLTGADWDLPTDQFAARIGLDAAVLRSGQPSAPLRTTVGAQRHPHKVEWGTPYLGVWGGFYQSLSNWGRPLLCVTRFAVDDLGLRFAWSVGNFSGEGPALATHSYVHCFMEVHPLYDKLYTFIFNAVHDTHAAVMDGLICGVGTDGTPAASLILLFHLDDEEQGPIPFDALSASCGRVYEHAAAEAARTGDPFAVLRELAPLDVLRVVCPTVGVPRPDGQIDHVLRVPAKRSLGMGKLTLNSLPANAPLRAVRANLRSALGLDGSSKVQLMRQSSA